MVCADADSFFVIIDVGDEGRNSDGGVFRSSRLGRWLQANGLNLPPPVPNPPLDENKHYFPFIFQQMRHSLLKPILCDHILEVL